MTGIKHIPQTTSTEADRKVCQALSNIYRRRWWREKVMRLESDKDRLRKTLLLQAPRTATVRDIAKGFMAGEAALEAGKTYCGALEAANKAMTEGEQ